MRSRIVSIVARDALHLPFFPRGSVQKPCQYVLTRHSCGEEICQTTSPGVRNQHLALVVQGNRPDLAENIGAQQVGWSCARRLTCLATRPARQRSAPATTR